MKRVCVKSVEGMKVNELLQVRTKKTRGDEESDE